MSSQLLSNEIVLLHSEKKKLCTILSFDSTLLLHCRETTPSKLSLLKASFQNFVKNSNKSKARKFEIRLRC